METQKYYLHDAYGPDNNQDFFIKGDIPTILEYIKKKLLSEKGWESVKLSSEEEWDQIFNPLLTPGFQPIESMDDPRIQDLYTVYLNHEDYEEAWLVRAKDEMDALSTVMHYVTTFMVTIKPISSRLKPYLVEPDVPRPRHELQYNLMELNNLFKKNKEAFQFLIDPNYETPFKHEPFELD